MILGIASIVLALFILILEIEPNMITILFIQVGIWILTRPKDGIGSMPP